MEDNSSSEEKTLPPSEKKLREAREKGQVNKSADMNTALVMLGCTLYIALSANAIEARVRHLINLTTRLYHEPFDTLWPRLMTQGMEVLLLSVLPLVVISIVAATLSSVVIMRGFLFSAEPIRPRPEHLNPVEGLKRIFSVRGIVEFIKSLLKVTALAIAFLVVYRLGLQSLMESPRCGSGCLEGIFVMMLKPLVITALIAFFIVGAIDVLMQRWLFRRDQRMTITEQKRERKDMYGDPEINRERKKQRRLMHAMSSQVGIQHASLMIGVADDWLVGLRYVRGETPVPVVTCKASPERSREMLRDAEERRIPVVGNHELAASIAKRTGNGDPVPDEVFQPVADALVKVGLI